MEPLKVVVSGPVGAGKSTLIRTLSETEVVDTDALTSQEIGKETTTVAMDYGTLHLGDQLLYLFGTPGQDRFDFMWDVLSEGALGLLMLIRGDRPEDFVPARRLLDYITSRQPVPFVLGVTRQDQPPVWGPEEVAPFFGVPLERVIGLNAKDPRSAVGPLLRLLELIMAEEQVS
jgi:signal recognition particle receptor subunit beta